MAVRTRSPVALATVGDSGLELEFAAFLAKCNDVTAFAKNYMQSDSSWIT